MPRHPRARLLAAVIGLLALVVASVACAATSADEVGGGYRLAASQLTTTTTTVEDTTSESTTSTTAVPGDWAVEVATAKGATVDVYTAKPGDPTSTIPQPAPGRVQPIPRADLNSAGSRITAGGWQFDNPTHFGNPLVFLVEENDGAWLKVHLPVRPNGSMGWIQASQVTLSEHDYHVEVDLSDAKVRAWDGDDLLGEAFVVYGAAGSPTPVGRFYINEKIAQSNTGGAYGPWILSTNAYSESMELFDGGLPVVALHGTNQPGLLGTAVSNGCVRMPNDLDILLANTLPPGTPVDVVA